MEEAVGVRRTGLGEGYRCGSDDSRVREYEWDVWATEGGGFDAFVYGEPDRGDWANYWGRSEGRFNIIFSD